jgi:WD40 repeat protein
VPFRCLEKPTLLPSSEAESNPNFLRIKSVIPKALVKNSLIRLQVVIWDDAKQRVVTQIPVLTTVRSVRLSRTHIVIALQNSIRVYNFKSSPDIWAVFETADNPMGLCCLGTKKLAFPGRTVGQVQLVELATANVSIIPAHGSSLRALDISSDGEILATASETVGGTFPVHDLSDLNREHWYEFGPQPAVRR